MKYVSVDIETSGLDPEKNQILSVGAVIEDTETRLPYYELPKFYGVIPQRDILGSPVALQMNAELINSIAEYHKDNEKLMDNGVFMSEDMMAKNFYDFLYINGLSGKDDTLVNQERRRVEVHGREGYYNLPVFGSKTKPLRINVAGKNFGTFDKLFLQKLPWWKKLINMNQRILDPAILFCDWKDDETLPNLSQCKERLGLDPIVAHTALEDAWDVVVLLRKFY